MRNSFLGLCYVWSGIVLVFASTVLFLFAFSVVMCCFCMFSSLDCAGLCFYCFFCLYSPTSCLSTRPFRLHLFGVLRLELFAAGGRRSFPLLLCHIHPILFVTHRVKADVWRPWLLSSRDLRFDPSLSFCSVHPMLLVTHGVKADVTGTFQRRVLSGDTGALLQQRQVSSMTDGQTKTHIDRHRQRRRQTERQRGR
jgi:hypothetical protein